VEAVELMPESQQLALIMQETEQLILEVVVAELIINIQALVQPVAPELL
jgi:hypothetical protein